MAFFAGCDNTTAPGGGPAPPDTIVTRVVVTPPSSHLLPGDTMRLTSTAHNAGGGILTDVPTVWTVTNPGAATVDDNGLVTALGVGATMIRATIRNKFDEASITVSQLNDAPTVALLSPDSTDAGFGVFTFAMHGTGFSNASQVLWNGTPRPTTYVSPTELRAVVGGADLAGPGQAEVRVRNPSPGGGVSDHVTFRINVAVASVVITPGSMQLSVGHQARLQATAYAADGGVIEGRLFDWSSSSQGAVSVDASGLIKATHVGTAFIFASTGGRTAQAHVEAVAPVAHVIVQPNPFGVLLGQQRQLTVYTFLANGSEVTGRTITYASDDHTVATVDAQGVVTGRTKGSTRVWATSEGVSRSVLVEVRQWGPGPTSTLDLCCIVYGIWPHIGDSTYTDASGIDHQSSKFINGGTLTLRTDIGRYEIDYIVSVVVPSIGEVLRETRTDQGTLGYVIGGGFWFKSDITQETVASTDLGPGELGIKQRVAGAPEVTYHWVLQ